MLNLGFENYTGRGYQLPFTYTNVMTLCDKYQTLNFMVERLDNYYEAAKNAVAIRASVRKYGRTRSMEALVGTSAINTALSFSMEGFWDTVKKAVRSIWEKIKEWALRFWHFMFSIDDRVEKTIKELNEAKSDLKHPVEYEGLEVRILEKVKTLMPGVEGALKAAGETNPDPNKLEQALKAGVRFTGDTPNYDTFLTSVTADVTTKYTLKTKSDVATRLGVLLDIIKIAGKMKEPLSKAIDNILKDVSKAQDDAKDDEEKDRLSRKYTAFKDMGKIVTKLFSGAASKATRDCAKIIAHIQYAN